MRIFVVFVGVLILVQSLSNGGAGLANAQRRFAPESPEVKTVVDRGIAFLTKAKPMGERGVLAALAIAEAGKRYAGAVPVDNPVIQSNVKQIVQGVKGGTLLRANAVYHPCLACILLCETDDRKYRPQIIKLIKSFEDRQLDDGGYAYFGKKEWDTSQTQYVALAYFVARQHNIPVNIDSARRILEFVIEKQTGPTWIYSPHEREARISIHAAVAGTAYLMGDLLQLQPRLKTEAKLPSDLGLELPPSISIHIPTPTNADNDARSSDAAWSGDGPLVDINGPNFKSAKAKANQHFENVFVLQAKKWSYYYLYAFERYAFFRAQAEGDVGNRKMKFWYDSGFELLKSLQRENGSLPDGPESAISAEINTAFAIMFLVRSSEILSIPPAESSLNGGGGLASLKGKKLKELKNGRIQSADASKDLNELLADLGSELSDDQLALLADSIKDAIRQYQSQPQKSRGKTRSFLRSLVADKNYYKRLIATRFLAGEQDLNNAPALIYALGDPDQRVCIEAHNGLRLISRKIDSIKLPAEPTLSDFQSVKTRWTQWLLKLRPDAVLLD